MKIDAYATIAGSHYKNTVERLKRDLKEEKIHGTLHKFDGIYRGVNAITGDRSTVDRFTFPIIIDNEVYVDLRSSTKVQGGDLVTTPSSQFEMYRAAIMHAQLHLDVGTVRNMSTIQMMLFGKLIAATLTNRLKLDINTSKVIEIFASAFYLQQIDPVKNDDERGMMSLAKRISTEHRLPLMETHTLLVENGVPNNIRIFAESLETITGSIRLKGLTAGAMFNMFAGVWFGTNATDNIAIMTEHPATFMAMLYMAVTDRSYRRKSRLGMLASNELKDDRITQYTRSVDALFYTANS